MCARSSATIACFEARRRAPRSRVFSIAQGKTWTRRSTGVPKRPIRCDDGAPALHLPNSAALTKLTRSHYTQKLLSAAKPLQMGNSDPKVGGSSPPRPVGTALDARGRSSFSGGCQAFQSAAVGRQPARLPTRRHQSPVVLLGDYTRSPEDGSAGRRQRFPAMSRFDW